MRPAIPLMLLSFGGIAFFVAFVMDTISDALTPSLGENLALAFSTTPIIAVLAVWGWYLYGPPHGARAEHEAEKRKEEGQ